MTSATRSELALVAALRAHEMTGGLCDPTVLPALFALGYDRDYDELAGVDAAGRGAAVPAAGTGRDPLGTARRTRVTLARRRRARPGRERQGAARRPGRRRRSRLAAASWSRSAATSPCAARGPDGPWAIGGRGLARRDRERAAHLAPGRRRHLVDRGANLARGRRASSTTSSTRAPGSCADGPYATATVAAADCVTRERLRHRRPAVGRGRRLPHRPGRDWSARLVRRDGAVEFVGGWPADEAARVIALTSPYLWYTTRATGLVTLVLFTLVVALGTLRRQPRRRHRRRPIRGQRAAPLGRRWWPWSSSPSTSTTTVVDSYVPDRAALGRRPVHLARTGAWRSVSGRSPWTSSLAVWISSLLKARMANTTWRFIHWFSWLAFDHGRRARLPDGHRRAPRLGARGHRRVRAGRRRGGAVALPRARRRAPPGERRSRPSPTRPRPRDATPRADVTPVARRANAAVRAGRPPDPIGPERRHVIARASLARLLHGVGGRPLSLDQHEVTFARTGARRAPCWTTSRRRVSRAAAAPASRRCEGPAHPRAARAPQGRRRQRDGGRARRATRTRRCSRPTPTWSSTAPRLLAALDRRQGDRGLRVARELHDGQPHEPRDPRARARASHAARARRCTPRRTATSPARSRRSCTGSTTTSRSPSTARVARTSCTSARPPCCSTTPRPAPTSP